MAATLQIPNEKPRDSRARVGDTETAPVKFNSELTKKLAELLTADDLEAAVKVWREGMLAVKMVWNAKLQAYIDGGPDWQIRRDMSELVAAYMEGRPMERQMVASGSFQELAELLNEMRTSGEAMRLMPAVRELPNESA